MEFISAEEFLKQPIEVQKSFLDWWKENVKQYDLFYRKFNDERQKYIVIKSEGYELETLTLRNKKISGGRDSWTEAWNIQFICDIVPLLTEGQLRQFIEDKTGGIVKVIQWNPSIDNEKYGYTIYVLAKDKYKVLCTLGYELLGTDLLQAYWQVALRIAKEEI